MYLQCICHVWFLSEYKWIIRISNIFLGALREPMTHGQSLRQTLITEKMSSFAGYGYYILIIHYIYNIIYIYIHIIHIHSKNKLQDFPPIQSVGSRTLSSKKTCLISSSGNTSGSSSTTHRSPEVVSKHGKHGKHDDTWSFPMVNTV